MVNLQELLIFFSRKEINFETFQDTLVLRYRGLHFGDHPITTYEKIDKYHIEAFEGKRTLVLNRTEIHDTDKKVRPKAFTRSVFEPGSMMSHQELFNVPIANLNQKMIITKDSIFFELKFGTEETRLTAERWGELIGFWNIDAYLMNKELEEGVQDELVMLGNHGRQITRGTMRLKVERKQLYRIENQDILAFRVSLTNMNELKTMNNVVFLMSDAFPRVVLRKEYVVHRTEEGSPFDSTGTDCLVGVEIRKKT